MRRLPWLLAAMLVVPAVSWCGPQDQNSSQTSSAAPQQDSLAEAARKARDQKKDAPKTAKVFTNDNIPTTGGISSVGTAPTPVPPAGNGSTTGTTGFAATTTPPQGSNEKSWRAKFAALHQKLTQDQADYDVMQRELGVLNLQDYSDPVKAMQQQMTRSDITKKTADIAAKAKQIDADKQAISDAEEDLRKSGGDPDWSR